MAQSDEFYLEILEEVTPLIEELGTTYVVSTQGGYNPATMKTDPPSSRDVVGLVADQSMLTPISTSGGSFVAASSWAGKKTLLLTADANPQEGESITVDGKDYAMADIKPIKPADIVMLYMLDVSL